MQGAEKESTEFDRISRVRHLRRLDEQFRRCRPHELHRAPVDVFQDCQHFRFARMLGGFPQRGASPPVAFAEPAGHQIEITFGSSALAKEHQSVLGDGNMADLPSEIAGDSWNWGEPQVVRNIVEKLQGVGSGELHLPQPRVAHGCKL